MFWLLALGFVIGFGLAMLAIWLERPTDGEDGRGIDIRWRR